MENNSTSDYIKYNNLLLADGSNKQQLTNDQEVCINSCYANPNCRGVNIVKNVGQNEVSADGYNYKTVPKITCEYVDNICYSNSKQENINSTFYAKKNNLQFENGTPFLLKNNGVCLSVKQSGNNQVLGSTKCKNKDVTPVLFDTEADTIKVGSEGDNCFKYSGEQLQLSKCNTYDTNQKFVYDHVYKTLRPTIDTTKCIVTSGEADSYNFNIGKADCKPAVESKTIFENYYKNVSNDDIEHFQNKDYSTDMTYYIIYVIALCIIAFLVIVLSK
jgi:hypothetical protein